MHDARLMSWNVFFFFVQETPNPLLGSKLVNTGGYNMVCMYNIYVHIVVCFTDMYVSILVWQ